MSYEEEFLKANFLSTALRVKEITTQINYRKCFNFHKILLDTKKFTISGACQETTFLGLDTKNAGS